MTRQPDGISLPPDVDLPTDRPRTARPAGEAGRCQRRLEVEYARAVRERADRHQVDPGHLIAAAVCAVLVRHSGQTTVRLGLPGDGGGYRCLPVSVDGDPSVPTLAGRLAGAVPVRVPDAPAVRLDWAAAGDTGRAEDAADTGPLRHELVIDVELGVDGCSLTGRYRSDLFDQTTIQRLLGHVETALAAVAVDGYQGPLSTMPLLTASELRQVLVDWNDTAMPLPNETTLHEAYAERAAVQPDATVLIQGGREWTFAGIDRHANRLAHHLRALGVGPGVRVALCLDRGPGLLTAILGVLKAGGAYVPLDADYPVERLAFMQEDAACAVLLTDAATLPRLPSVADKTVLLDEHAEAIAAAPAHCPEPTATPDDLCYVIYTSGSTGKPKGIALRHRGVVNNLLDLNTRFAVGPGDSVLALSSSSFDMSVYEMLGMTVAGGTVVVPGAAGRRDPDHWLTLARRHRITVWNSAPALLGALVGHCARTPGSDLSSVRLAMLGGDWVAQTLPDRLRAYAPRARVIVMGGATESSIHSTIFEAGAPEPGWTSIPYGRPMANQRTYVLDPAGQPVPIGVPGELHLAGVGLAEGYLGRPALTAEKFFAWSYGPVQDERLYRTGDLVRYRPDGLIELLGRMDFQTKIRGLRVELGEIESALREQPGVAEAVVVARQDAAGDKELVGYVVAGGAGGGPAVDVQALRKALEARLPDYMVPSQLAVLPRLPLSPNGKLDRAALGRLSPPVAQRTARGRAPADEVERVIAELWCELLNVSAVGVADRFGELGGHSLKAMQLVSRLRHRLDVELSVGDVLAAGDLGELADVIRSARTGTAPARSVAPLPAGPAPGERSPLSPAQERLWYLHRLAPDSPVYHVSVATPWPAGLDVGRLERALNRLVARHAALRTAFFDADGQAWQAVRPVWHLAVATEDVEPDRLAAAIRTEAVARFDLGAGQPLRARILRAGGQATLVLTTHHIVTDGWSLDLLFEQLERLYEDPAASADEADPAGDRGYLGFVAWQREHMRDGGYDADLAYWQGRLSGAPAALELPGDFPRPAQQSFSGGMRTFRWPAQLGRDLAALSQAHRVTLFMTLFAGFTALLSRYSGQTDLVVGTPVAGRSRQEWERLAGFFVNTLPLRVDLGGEPTFAELLGRVRTAALAAYRHQDVPFDLIVERLHPERDPSRMPVVQAMFQLNDVPMREISLGGHRLLPRLLDTGTAKFDLSVTLERRDDVIDGLIEYNGDILTADTADLLVAYFENMMRASAAHPDVAVSRLPLVSDAERDRLVLRCNDTAAPLPAGACVHDLVDTQARERGDAPAVEHDGTVLSYAELAARSNRLARYLRRLGVGRGSRVGISMERSTDLVVGLLAILKAGAAYVPLDVEYPADRLSFMVDDAGVEVLLSHRRTRGALVRPGLREVVVDDESEADAIGHEPATPPRSGSGPGDLAYVIYTSGSTGRPKGVMIPHRAVVRLIHRPNYLRLGEACRIAQASNASFDAYTFEAWGALANGGCLVVLPKEVVVNPAELAGAIRRTRLTTMFLTTAAVNTVARYRPDAFAPLRELLFGGEAVEPRWVRAILDAGPPRRLVHVYGPTEVTTFATFQDLDAVPDRVATLPIGRPISNTESHVLDRAGAPVPPGFVGELYLGGIGLTDGYLGRPALTAERLTPHPFGRPGERLYRTGDLVKLRPDGAVEFVGRTDDLVKIRGFRIELGEIETALLRHPAIAAAAVLVVSHDEDKRLVACVCPSTPVEPAQLRAHLRRLVPEQLVPATYHLLDELPLSPNGKVDRRALLDRYAAAPGPVPASVAEPAPARNPAEQVIVGIWADVLGVDRVGIDDDFFSLGGHSLLAIRLLSETNRAFGIDLPLAPLLASPTPRALAEQVAQRTGGAPTAVEPVRPRDRTRPAPLSYPQQRLWFMDQLVPGSAVYHVPTVLRFAGRVDAPALRAALGDLVTRHEGLRTRFVAERGVPRQEVTGGFEVDLPEVDMSGEAGAERRAAEIAADEAARPFDLAAGPLLRVRLLHLPGERDWLLLTMHHIVVDGAALEVMLSDLAELYRARATGTTSDLAPVTLHAADFAVWQRDRLTGAVLDGLVDYWRRTLGVDPAGTPVPADHAPTGRREFRGGVVTRQLSPALGERVRAVSRSARVTPYVTLLACLQALLAQWTGRSDVTVGTPVAGRTRPEFQDVVGCLINMIPVRTDLAGVQDRDELLARVRHAFLGAFAHQDLPFDRMVEALVSRRSRVLRPIFQVMFNLNEELRVPGFAGIPVAVELGWPQDTAQFELGLVATEHGGGYLLALQYDSDVLGPETATAVLAAYEDLLAGVAAGTPLPVVELPTGKERSA